MGVKQMTHKKAIIYEEVGADPAVDRIITKHGDHQTTIVAVPEPAVAVEVAIELVNEGVDLIEVCGSFSPLWHVKVVETVGSQVPVGSILYGFESLTRVAEYKARFAAGEPMTAAFLYVENGADPAVDRTVRVDKNGNQITFVAVPEPAAAAPVAVDLVEAGVGLIELYGGLGAKWAAQVIEAIDQRVPVGFRLGSE